jgi:arylsulfatase A-like enzyme
MQTLRVLALLSLSIGVLGGCFAEPKPRVFFVGVDGANWKVIGPMIEAGELPNFSRLVREGAVMREFGTMDTTSSAVVWTTVATGRESRDHGVTQFTENLPNGERIPISSNSRRAKAIWEIATENDVSVGVAGWWASWPAEEVNGWIISDHANPAFSEFLISDQIYWTADAEKLGALNRDLYPADLASILASHWLEKANFDYAELQRRGQFTDVQIEVLKTTPWNQRLLYSILKTFYIVDYPIFTAAKQLYIERPTDLTMLYMRGPDPIQHYGWNLVEPDEYGTRPPNLERDRGLVRGVYRYVDTFLGELLKQLDANTWLIVASDHGAEPTRGSDSPTFKKRPGGHTTAAKGALFVAGPHVKAGYQIKRGDPRDMMPTLAWLLDLPLSEELAGSPITDAFAPEFVAAHPTRMLPTYGERQVGSTTSSNADAAMIESLKALGYIEE